MNTTKRKFNALLQGIGARSSPQLSSEQPTTTHQDDFLLLQSSPLNHHQHHQYRPSTPDSIAVPAASSPTIIAAGANTPVMNSELFKRRRVGVLESTTGNDKTGGATTISNVVLKKWTPGGKPAAPSPSKDAKTTSAPKYCPGDRDELIRRLGTFQELTEWTPKPDRVNEIEWAKRGWVCQGKERVRCTLCNKELVVKTSKREVEGKEVSVLVGSDFEEALVKKFVELIIDAHQEDCLWRKRGCDDTLLRLPLAHPATAIAALRERYDDLCTRPAFLPYLFNLRLPPTLHLDAIKSQLPPTFFTTPSTTTTTPTKPNDVALALALTGWQGLTNPRIGAVPNSASCATCQRRLGLWLFKSKEVDPATGTVLVPAPMDHLDPVREHRFFCPWRSPAAQHNPGSRDPSQQKAAWEVLAQTVRNDAFLRAKSGGNHNHNHHRPTASLPVPVTPTRGATHAHSNSTVAADAENGDNMAMLGPSSLDDEEEDDKARDAKDKERWARLRRVKSLFDTKGGRRLRRTISRPGTPTGSAAGSGAGGGIGPPTAHGGERGRHGSVPPPETGASPRVGGGKKG
ncbi:zf-C3HC-domain-containing protein [Whalleya microplaca]|nr:zf-C3HC-domain-containing protein [Whalleya microplaca]